MMVGLIAVVEVWTRALGAAVKLLLWLLLLLRLLAGIESLPAGLVLRGVNKGDE
jgi:hypothetical protein